MSESFSTSVMISDTDPSGSIIFEVPLTKQSRSFLRLERVFKELHRHISIATPSAHFFALKQLFLLLDFFERGDFKAELIKELDREIAYFAKLESNPEVDLSKLDTFIKQLKQLSHWFKNQKGKIGHQLLKQDFIANAKKKLTLPIARLSFDAPFVKLFLTMPVDVRKEKLNGWLKVFKGIQTSVDVLLRLSRETANFHTVFAEDGFYQQEIDKESIQFIGIKIPEDLKIYPEVSSGPNRFSIHFMKLTEDLETEPFSNWLDFELAQYR